MKQFYRLLLITLCLMGGVIESFAVDVTVYAKYGGSSLNLYILNTSSVSDTWPGEAMEKFTAADGSTWFKRTFSMSSANDTYSIIFNYNGTQTDDIHEQSGSCAYNVESLPSYSWSDQLPLGGGDMYVIGKGSDLEWSTTPSKAPMQQDGNIYTWTGTLDGDFALVNGTNYESSWTNLNRNRYSTGGSVTPEGSPYTLSTGDKSSSIAEGKYRLTFDASTLKLTIEKVPDEMYLIGDVIASSPQGVAMTNNGNGVFTWEGFLDGWFSFTKIYSDEWNEVNSATNRFGPSTDATAAVVGNNAVNGNGANAFTIGYGKYRLTFNFATKQLNIESLPYTPESYYFMSELSNYEKWECFKLYPSRVRNGGPESERFFTIHIQDFLMQSEHNEFGDFTSTGLHWYIESSTGKQYRPYDADYELGNYDQADDLTGKGVVYQTYNTYTGTSTNKFKRTQFYGGSDSSKKGESFTVFFDQAATANGGPEGQVQILINARDKFCGYNDVAENYFIVGNFDKADASVQLEPWNERFRRQLIKYYYKDGLQYTSEIAEADSIVLRTTIAKPTEGWGDLFLLVFRAEDIQDADNSWNDWKSCIRPEVQWTPGGGDGLDATALIGGLFTRKNEDEGVTEFNGINMAINPLVDDDNTSYTFSINLTTSTYRITFNKYLFLMGPAVSTNSSTDIAEGDAEDTSKASGAWSSQYHDAETAHALKLTYNASDRSYRYVNSGGEEQDVYLTNGQRFAFVWDKNFADAFYAEDDQAPVSLVDNSRVLDIDLYNAPDNGKGNYDTQFVNYLSIYALPKKTFDPQIDYDVNYLSGEKEYTVDGAVFNLPSGYYRMRLYVNTINEKQYIYYTVGNRTHAFYSPGATTAGAKQLGSFNAKAQYRSFADYHAVVIPSGISVYTLTNPLPKENNVRASITLSLYTLQRNEETGEYNVLPANTPVLLVRDVAAAQFNTPIDGFEYYGYNPRQEGPAVVNYLKPQINREAIPVHVGADYDNFVFGYKKIDEESQYTIGFYHPGSGTSAINSAYVQLPYNFLDDATEPAGALLLVADGYLTDIEDNLVMKQESSAGTIYTLDGRQAAPGSLAKGIYVVNGKKFVVK